MARVCERTPLTGEGVMCYDAVVARMLLVGGLIWAVGLGILLLFIWAASEAPHQTHDRDRCSCAERV